MIVFWTQNYKKWHEKASGLVFQEASSLQYVPLNQLIKSSALSVEISLVKSDEKIA